VALQIRQREKLGAVSARETIAPRSDLTEGSEEVRFGRRVVRDDLGPASSINMAHGMVLSGAEGEIIAVTDEDAFLHSGLPAFVNTLYNGSTYVLVVKTKTRATEIERALAGFGFETCRRIGEAGEIERYGSAGKLSVLLYEGDL